ncbi:MAG: Ig-like domain-containing protein, partial [Gammaproteobacteria bacterium]|nr:Ig-like domain-containing protein [Gammaproteobacteria bacterium]
MKSLIQAGRSFLLLVLMVWLTGCYFDDADTQQEQVVAITVAPSVSLAQGVSAAQLPQGARVQYQATVYYRDGSHEVMTEGPVWRSNNDLASVSQSGMVTAHRPGVVEIEASLGSISGASPELTVTDAVVTAIQVTPATVSMAKGYSQSLVATATYSDQTSADISSLVAWRSDDSAVATVTASGLLAGVGVGSTTVSASLNGISSNTATVTVTDAELTAIQVTPAIVSLAKGYSQTLTATATYSDQTSADISSLVVWRSDDSAVATINPSGLMTGVGVGSTTVSATLNGISSNTATVTVTDAVVTAIQVTPATVSMAKGNSQSLTAMAIYSDLTSADISAQVAWSSADSAIATINPAGLLAGAGVGSTTVIASLNGVSSNTATVTVTDAVVTAIQLTPAIVSLAKGYSQPLTATATYSDQTSADISSLVAWSSADSAVATINPSGLLAGVGVGSTTVIASLNGLTSNTATVTVTDAVVSAIQVTPATVSLAKG